MSHAAIRPRLTLVTGLAALLVITTLPPWAGDQPAVRDRWRSWPIPRIFPVTIPGLTPSGARTFYQLAGVSPEASCEQSLQPGAVWTLARHGCLTTLRATYVDVTQTFVVTAGIAVLKATLPDMPDAPPPSGRATMPRPATVRPTAFPGPSAGFGDAQYVTGAVLPGSDRYLVLTAAGYADGREYRPSCPPDERLTKLARDLASWLLRRLTA